jgi:hypothetical protein
VTGLAAFLIGSPLKLAIWAVNRLLTWTGLLVVWRRLKGVPDRPRRFLVWLVALNAASALLLMGLFRVLSAR